MPIEQDTFMDEWTTLEVRDRLRSRPGTRSVGDALTVLCGTGV